MDYEVQIVGDDDLAADWVLIGRCDTFFLITKPEFNTPAVHAQARALMLSLAA